MAIARCETCGRPKGTKLTYNHSHKPLSPSSGIMCGAPSCNRPACIWLTNEEERAYVRGWRTFRLANRRGEFHLA
jgi:hypothetical protein